ncbi:MAG: cyclic nucleotide-binding domain-containing protein [Deltaproteobacteria bacterium]
MNQQRHDAKRLLKYLKGEQIIKQGDYGISIYKVLSGKVQVFRKSDSVEVPLAILGPGGIIGEMAFLSRDAEVRSASVGAIEDTELQVWHPRELAKKYEQTSPMIKAITDQALNRLRRINRFMDKLAIALASEPSEKSFQDSGAWKSKREFYRKKIYIPCRYAPASRPKGFVFLRGYITDLSMGGLGLQISTKNDSVIPHEPGESFQINTELPNGKDLSLTAQIVSVKKTGDKVRLGMKFENLPDYQEAKKTLWFFLLPT